jgi:hypothetical protein
VVVPETDGVNSTAENPIPIPEGLVAALQNQLDIGSVPGPPAIEVFVNEAWFPVGAQLSGATAEASELAGADALVRADLSDAEPAMIGADAWPAATDDVTAGVLHLAIPYDPRLHLTVDGDDVPSRPSFGVETAFDVPVGGSGVLAYEREASRSLWLAVQAVLWIAVLAVGIGAQASFVRRRTSTVYDETLIDLTGAPPISVGVAGEVLGLPVWEEEGDGLDEADDPERTVTLPAENAALAGAPTTRPARPVPSSGATEPAVAARTRRDTTPPRGIRPVAPAAPEELDLAGLVASVDEQSDDVQEGGAGGPDRDAPGAPHP